MKRDWDLIRQQLITIEEENDLFTEIPSEPKWLNQTEAEYLSELQSYDQVKNKILGHFELLIKAEYIEGLSIIRSTRGLVGYNLHNPRLTMNGHDFLDTIRSKTVWSRINTKAKSEGIELTFDAIKELASFVIKGMLG